MTEKNASGAKKTKTDLAANAAKQLGVRSDGDSVTFDAKSLSASLGGWLGIVESVAPATAFILTFAISSQVLLSVVVAVSVSIVFIARQLIKGKPLTQAIAGLIGIFIAAYLPLRPGGEARDYFVPGFFTNLGYGGVLLLSVLVRWPIIGVLVGFLKGWGTSWRTNVPLRRRFDLVTLLWVGLFGGRLLVQVPLYFADSVTALGIARIVMGVPLYALCIWLSWLALRAVILAKG